jgi:hypothetical protein
MVKEWKDQGCEYCRENWQKYDERLILLKDSAVLQARLYQCPRCKSYWEENQRYACEVSEEEARKSYEL